MRIMADGCERTHALWTSTLSTFKIRIINIKDHLIVKEKYCFIWYVSLLLFQAKSQLAVLPPPSYLGHPGKRTTNCTPHSSWWGAIRWRRWIPISRNGKCAMPSNVFGEPSRYCITSAISFLSNQSSVSPIGFASPLSQYLPSFPIRNRQS